MRPSPLPTAFPALGHDISTTSRTHPEDLSAQKVNLSIPKEAQTSRSSKDYNLRAGKLTVNEITNGLWNHCSNSDARGLGCDNNHDRSAGICTPAAHDWLLPSFLADNCQKGSDSSKEVDPDTGLNEPVLRRILHFIGA